MLDFTPTPGLRKGRGGRDDDEGDALVDKDDKEVGNLAIQFFLSRSV